MNIGYKKKLTQRLALLLVAACFTQTATAFAVEKETDGVISVSSQMTAGPDIVVSENAEGPQDPLLRDDTEEKDSADIPVSISGNTDMVVSQDEAEVSLDAVPLPEASVSGGAVGVFDEKCSELNGILSSKTVRAVLYGCDQYALKKEPSADSETVLEIPCATTVILRSVSFDGEKLWFMTTACLGETEAYGYIEKDKLICIDEDYTTWENGLSAEAAASGLSQGGVFEGAVMSVQDRESRILDSIESFPQAYKDKLYALHSAHPSWVFVPQDPGISLTDAVNGEYADKNRNWVARSASDSYKEGQADSSGSWYYASKSCISYYMNPVNFLDDSHVFQFEQMAFNSTYHTQAGVQSILNDTFMKGKIEDDTRTYAEAFMEIGRSQGLSPYHLSSRVRQEQGVNGTSPLISGTYPGYVGYYNYFNIQATGSDVVKNGLEYAKKEGWNTRYKSLDGGASFIGNGYIKAGQDTLYLEKFDLVGTFYTHQYMQNVQAPSNEAVTTYNQYKSAGMINNPFVFKIPVFKEASGGNSGQGGNSGSGGGAGKDSVNTVKPQASLKLVSKANLFYSQDDKQSFAKYRINSNVDIYGIKTSDQTASKAGGNPYFEVCGAEGNVITLKTKNRDATNTKYTSKKCVLTVSSDAGVFDVAFDVSYSITKPSFKASPAVIYNGFESGVVALTDNKGNDVSLPSDTKVLCSDGGMTCTVSADESYISVVTGSSFTPGTKTFTLESASWTSPVLIKTQVKKGGVPAVKVAKKNVTLNTLIPMDQYGTLNVKAGIDGSGIRLNFLSISGDNTKTENALRNGLYAEYDSKSRMVKLGVKGSSLAKGTYTLILNGSINDAAKNPMTAKSTKMTVKVIEKTPDKAFTLSRSGKINLVDRADTCFVYTPGMAGTGASRIESIEGADNAGFDIVLLDKGDITADKRVITQDTGAVMIKAKDSAALDPGVSYSLGFTAVLDNGLKIRKTVSVKPVQAYAKIYGNIVTAAMTRSSSVSRDYIIRTKGQTANDTVIEKVEPDFGPYASSFSYKPYGTQGSKRYYSALFELKNKDLKIGTYNLKFKVYIRGAGRNTKPSVVTLKVRLR